MIKSIFNGVSGYITYKGGAGHLAFMMHRVSGLATLVFLSMHILLESTAHFAPYLYNKLNAGLRSPIALMAEILLAFFVIFHSVNGFRIAYADIFRVDLWAGAKSAKVSWIISFVLWIPTLIIMILHTLHLI